MNPEAARLLAEHIAREGVAWCRPGAESKGLIADICGVHRKEAWLLWTALQYGAVAGCQAEPPGRIGEAAVERLARALADEASVSAERAGWAVQAWAFALHRAADPPAELPPSVAWAVAAVTGSPPASAARPAPAPASAAPPTPAPPIPPLTPTAVPPPTPPSLPSTPTAPPPTLWARVRTLAAGAAVIGVAIVLPVWLYLLSGAGNPAGGRPPPPAKPAPPDGDDPPPPTVRIPTVVPGIDKVINSIGMDLVRLPPGRYTMGSPESEEGRRDDEGPAHPVVIARSIRMAAHPVTQGQFREVMGYNPSWFSPQREGRAVVAGMDTDRFPVEYVSWEDAALFCRRLSERPEEKRAGRRYRLPTEAEREYAARAGSSAPFGLGPALSSHQANFDGRSPYGGASPGPYLERTVPVGSHAPNVWSLYDLQGNVWEWCADWYAPDAYRRPMTLDPTGPAHGERRVIRGGCWQSPASELRAAARDGLPPTERSHRVGFRVVCEIAE
jgi:formylglycine-generating enzyme required for sulfatase activity